MAWAQTSAIQILSLSPSTVATGGRLDLSIQITNTGGNSWNPIDPLSCHRFFDNSAPAYDYATNCRPYPLGIGSYGIRLEAHPLSAPDPVNTYLFTDLALPRILNPGETIILNDYVFATLAPGRYRLAVITLRYGVYAFTSRILNSPQDSLDLGATIDFTVGDVRTVSIDIKPGESPNSINLGSEGNIAVAILSDSGFDARKIDPATVTLSGAVVRTRGKGAFSASTDDVNHDGFPDLVLHFNTADLALTPSSTEAVLEGQSFDRSLSIRGTDSVRIVP